MHEIRKPLPETKSDEHFQTLQLGSENDSSTTFLESTDVDERKSLLDEFGVRIPISVSQKEKKDFFKRFGIQISPDNQVSLPQFSLIPPQIYRFYTAQGHLYANDVEGGYQSIESNFPAIIVDTLGTLLLACAKQESQQLAEVWLMASQKQLGIMVIGSNTEVLMNHAVVFSPETEA